jgi:hypothetical protein
MMHKRPLAILFAAAPLLAAAAFASGCKPATCESICESKNQCPDATMQVADCAKSCDTERSAAETAGCSSQLDSLISCQGSVTVCQSDTFCTAQNAAYVKCLADACKADPKKCGG